MGELYWAGFTILGTQLSIVKILFSWTIEQRNPAEQFYKGINKVQPSLIRTEADELTYHFHVMIRYEIEKMLIEGSIITKDIPAYWNEHYKKYLGVTVPDDKRGCLQDVHWSHGSFGYFATYSIGSLYAAQLFAAISNEHPFLNKDISRGEYQEYLKLAATTYLSIWPLLYIRGTVQEGNGRNIKQPIFY